MKNKILLRNVIFVVVVIFLVITGLHLFADGDSSKFDSSMRILYIIVTVLLILNYIYTTTIRMKYNKIITNFNNDASNVETLEKLKKLSKFYLPPRIKNETKNSIELIEKFEAVEQGIKKLTESDPLKKNN